MQYHCLLTITAPQTSVLLWQAILFPTCKSLTGPCRTIRIALLLNNRTDDCLLYLVDLRLSLSMRLSLFNFQLTDIPQIAQEKHTLVMFPASGDRRRNRKITKKPPKHENYVGDQRKGMEVIPSTATTGPARLTPIHVICTFYLKMDIGNYFSTFPCSSRATLGRVPLLQTR